MAPPERVKVSAAVLKNRPDAIRAGKHPCAIMVPAIITAADSDGDVWVIDICRETSQ